MVDFPAAYRNQPGLAFVASVPSTWDETRVLNAAVGDAITIARRSGDQRYVGSMVDSAARELKIPLNFLPSGEFTATIYRDDIGASDTPARLIQEKRTVTAEESLTAKLAPAGGHVIQLTPLRTVPHRRDTDR